MEVIIQYSMYLSGPHIKLLNKKLVDIVYIALSCLFTSVNAE